MDVDTDALERLVRSLADDLDASKKAAVELAAENARLRQRAEKAEEERDTALRLESDLAAALGLDDWEHPADLLSIVRALKLGDEEAAAALDERDAMRPVVEAAEAFVVADRGSGGFVRAKAGTALFEAVDAWRAAQPGDTPGALVPGEDDVAEEPAARADQKAPACICPWNNGYHVGNPLGHHVSCPSLRQVHTPDDDCRRTGVPGAGHVDQKAPTDRPSATESQDQGADDGAGTAGSQAQGGAQGDVEAFMREEDELDATYSSLVAHDKCDRCGGKLPKWECDLIDRSSIHAPADPAGLDAAIEAARIHLDGSAWLGNGGAALVAVRAAAPHLRAAALNEAADEMAGRWPEPWTAQFALWLRERAGRIGGGE